MMHWESNPAPADRGRDHHPGQVPGYIRRRRLEQARLELLTPADRQTVAELAAPWQFADSSHLIRAFKSGYGLTPAEFARRAAHPDGRWPSGPPT
ncbi:helix-turn-helix domain-containing protein [Streptomyces sp. NPDC001076]